MDQEIDITKELDTKIKIPKDVRESIYTKVFNELGIAIFIILYSLVLKFSFTKIDENTFTNCVHGISSALCVFAIVLFELAYKKNSEKIGLYGVEQLVLSIISLFMPYIYFKRSTTFKNLYSLFGLYISVYYVIKAFVVYIIEVRKYKAGLSDIKEIVNDKNESYLEEKSKRKFEDVEDVYDRNEDIAMRKRDSIKNTLIKITHLKSKENIKAEQKQEEKPKRRRGRPRKKTVVSLATASRKKKKDGENDD